tara:strand:+ start:1709 stop:2260 length:552 start_codon:yes stop_codon:yes gene_type:complete
MQEAHNTQALGGLRPRVLFVNSHAGQGKVIARIGLFRLLCTNGLIVSEGRIAGFQFPHTQSAKELSEVLTESFFADVLGAVESANRWKDINLDEAQRIDLATIGRNLRFGEDSPVMPSALLLPHRYQDSGKDLWSTFNTIQENTNREGIKLAGARRRTRRIRSIDKDLSVNSGLWDAAAAYAQ